MTVVSGPDGSFGFDAPPSGLFNLEAARGEDFKVFRFGLPIDPSVSLDVGSLTLEQTGRISTRVRTRSNQGGAPVGGGTLYVPGSAYVGKSDAAGRVSLEAVAPGSYAIRAVKPGLGAATAVDVLVRPGQTTEIQDLLLAADDPFLTRISRRVAAPGALLDLEGGYFGHALVQDVSVKVGGAAAPVLGRTSDSRLRIAVPEGARTGNVVVAVGGRSSNPQALVVLETLELKPGRCYFLAGRTGQVEVSGRDTSGLEIKVPAVDWAIAGGAATVASGSIAASSADAGEVVARLGRLIATASYRAFPSTVASVRIKPAEIRVGSRWSGAAKVIAENLMADGSTNSAISFEIFPSSAATVSDDVLVVPSAGPGNALARLAAWSLLDRRVGATATVDIWNEAVVSTVAGSSQATGGDGPALGAKICPGGLVLSTTGDLVFSDQCAHSVRILTPDGTVRTIAGGPTAGFAEGPADRARFNVPSGVALDEAGNLYVADYVNNRIRLVDSDGAVSTLAGDGSQGFRDGVGSSAALSNPGSLAFAPDGKLFFTEQTLDDKQFLRYLGPGGVVTTLAGGKTGHRDGPMALAGFSFPYGLAVSHEGAVFVAEYDRVRKIVPARGVTTFLGQPPVWQPSLGGTGLTWALSGGLATDRFGNLYVANGRNIQVAFPDGRVSRLAGSDGAGFADGMGDQAMFNGVWPSMAITADGVVFVADGKRIRRVGR